MRLSGTITVVGRGTVTLPDLITVSKTNNLGIEGWLSKRHDERQYNWNPWCIVKTDHRYYLQIETIDHSDNNYNAGKRRYPYEKATFNHWQYIFTGKLEPVTLPTLSSMRQQ